MFTLTKNKTPKVNDSWKHMHDEYRYLRVLRILSIFSGGIFATLLLWVVFFSYEHIYLTIGKVHNILILKASSSVEVIHFDAYEKARSAWVQRTEAPLLPEITRSPFDEIEIKDTVSTTPKL